MTHPKTNKLAEAIVERILESKLNITLIPDELERDLYLTIFNILEEELSAQGCFQRLTKTILSIIKK